jgi:folate-binding protein YgfZ
MTAVLVEAGPDKGAIWHFGQPNHEQRDLFAGKGWADLSHRGLLSITGADRLTWLHALTTQHLENLTPGTWSDALILDANGRIEYQLFLVDDGTTTYLHTEKERMVDLISYLEKMKFMLRVDVADLSATHTLLRAPGLPDNLGGPYAILPLGDRDATIAAFDSVATQVGTWALEAERIAAGRARLLLETDNKSIPNELGFLNRAVHMQKGCYRGQETVAKVFNLGAPPRRLVLLHLDGSMATLPNHGDKVFTQVTAENPEAKEVGFIGSAARHYELGPIALAVIRRNTPADIELIVDGVTAMQEVLN